MNLPLTARRTGRVATGLLVTLLLLSIGAAPAAAASPPAPEPVRVIVELTEPAALTTSGSPHRVDQQQDAVVAAADDHGLQIQVHHTYRYAFNGLAVELPAGELSRLGSLPGVGAVHPDRPVQAVLDDSVPLVGAPEVWPGEDGQGRPLDGTGQVVAVVDTGVDYSHPDLGGGFGAGHKVIAGYDFVNDDADPMDDHSHGTHVAAIAAGRADQPGGVTGVAPGAQVTAYKVLNAAGAGSTATVLAGLDAAVAADNPHRASVVNISLGAAPTIDDPLAAAANAAVAAGVMVVAAAGNDGPAEGSVLSPAIGEDVLAVGASTSGIREPAAALVAPVARDLRPQRHWASANAADQPTEAEVVDLGHGRPEEFAGKDLAGKAVLVHTTGAGDADVAERAEAAGAVAAMFHDPEPQVRQASQTATRGVPEPTAWEDGRPDRIVSMWISESDGSDIRRMLAAGPVRITYHGLPGDDRLAAFSARGPVPGEFRLKPELTAPGVEIRSALPTDLWPHGYFRFSGTSMAAPHVAGAAAILRQLHPDWAPRQVGSLLAGTAGPVQDVDALGQGAGRLDLLAASRASVVAETWAIDFGLADLGDPQVTAEAALPLVNLGDTTATVELAGTDEVAVSPETVQVGPGERVTATATLTAERPAARRNLTGWVVATVAGDGPALRIPYLSAIRPLLLRPLPDPAVGETSLAVASEVPLDAAPAVTITDPRGRSVTRTAEPDRLGWVVRYQPRKRGVHRVTATGTAAGVTLYQETTFEAVGPGGGHRWEQVGPNFDGGALAFAAGPPGRAYALPSHAAGLFRTDDHGASWHELRDLPGAGGLSEVVVTDPRRPGTVYLAVNREQAYRGRVYTSHDAGRSWQALPVPNAVVSDLAVGLDGRVLVLVGEAGTFVSPDAGESWERLDAPDGVSQAMIVGRDLYLGSFDGLFVIRDVAGHPQPAQQLPVKGRVSNLAGDRDLLLVASGGAGYASTDRGASWRQIFPTDGASGFATGVHLVGDQVAVVTGGTAWFGDRPGTGWQPVPLPGAELGFSTATIGSWPDRDTLVVGVTRLGVFASTDRGESYDRIGVPGTPTYSVGVADGPDGTVLLAGTWKGSVSTPLPGRVPVTEWGFTGIEWEFLDQQIGAFAAAPGKVYRTRYISIHQLFIEQSTDGGQTWRPLATENGRPGDLVVHPADPDRVYLALAGSQDAGVMVSRDGGAVWRRAEHTDFVAVAADPRHPDRLWLGGPTGLYSSVDGGETVTRLDSRPVSAIAVDPADPDRLLIGGERLRYSEDGGQTLHEAGYADLPLVVTDLEFGPDGTAYAATGGRGVLGSTDGGRRWAAIGGLPNRNVTDLQLVPGWLYAATDGGGVYRLPVR